MDSNLSSGNGHFFSDLFKGIDILELASENIEITVPSAVVEELREMSKISDREGKATEDMLALISKKKSRWWRWTRKKCGRLLPPRWRREKHLASFIVMKKG